jgi:hypothetical protein
MQAMSYLKSTCIIGRLYCPCFNNPVSGGTFNDPATLPRHLGRKSQTYQFNLTAGTIAVGQPDHSHLKSKAQILQYRFRIRVKTSLRTSSSA